MFGVPSCSAGRWGGKGGINCLKNLVEALNNSTSVELYSKQVIDERASFMSNWSDRARAESAHKCARTGSSKLLDFFLRIKGVFTCGKQFYGLLAIHPPWVWKWIAGRC